MPKPAEQQTDLGESLRKIGVAYNKRLTFIGKTGSGKSVLSWVFLRIFLAKVKDLQVIFVDPKHEHSKFGEGVKLSEPKLVQRYEPDTRIQIFQTYYWTDALDDMINQVLQRGKVIVVFDELGGLATATKVPEGMVRVYTQGRGKGVGAWSMLQSVKRYPQVIKQQSEIFFVFRITDEKDRKDLGDYIPDVRVIENKIPKWYFWVYNDSWDQAIFFQPIEVPERWKPS